MFGNYLEVRDWLENFIPLVYGKEELGLLRIENLLAKLGNPQTKFKSIHVAGTSGKGSMCFYTAILLEKVGFKVGLHISPHLVDIRERMMINGQMIPIRKFLVLFGEIKRVVEQIQKEKPDLTPSYFEILVAASFKYFAQEKVDWAVVEVGLGGRLDATNVLQSRIAVITNIGLDHTEILGKTVEKIAYEKAGIIKTKVPEVSKVSKVSKARKYKAEIIKGKIGIPVVTGASGRALKVITDVARERQAPLITIDTQNGQETNKFLALAAVRTAGIEVDQSAMVKAFKAKFAGRLEEIEAGVILDGAHNPDKIRFLIDFVGKYQDILRAKREVTAKNRLVSKVSSRGARTINEITLVLAFKKGKNWKEMVDLLLKNLPVKKVIATQFYATTDMGKYQAVEPAQIADYVKSVYRLATTVYSNSQEAVFGSVASLTPGVKSGSHPENTPGVSRDLVLVTGSLYLVGEVRTMWKLPQF